MGRCRCDAWQTPSKSTVEKQGDDVSRLDGRYEGNHVESTAITFEPDNRLCQKNVGLFQ